MEYEKLRNAVKEAPVTWLPGLLQALIEANVEKGCFKGRNGFLFFVNRIFNKLGVS